MADREIPDYVLEAEKSWLDLLQFLREYSGSATTPEAEAQRVKLMLRRLKMLNPVKLYETTKTCPFGFDTLNKDVRHWGIPEWIIINSPSEYDDKDKNFTKNTTITFALQSQHIKKGYTDFFIKFKSHNTVVQFTCSNVWFKDNMLILGEVDNADKNRRYVLKELEKEESWGIGEEESEQYDRKIIATISYNEGSVFSFSSFPSPMNHVTEALIV